MTTFKRISSATSMVKKLSPISAGKKEGKATVLALKEPGLAANLSCREDWSTGRQFLMACCHEKSATGSHLLCSSQTARKGRRRGREGEKKGNALHPYPCQFPFANSFGKGIMIFHSVEICHVSNHITPFLWENSGLKADFSFTSIPFPPFPFPPFWEGTGVPLLDYTLSPF